MLKVLDLPGYFHTTIVIFTMSFGLQALTLSTMTTEYIKAMRDRVLVLRRFL
jgi:hypothetical protein